MLLSEVRLWFVIMSLQANSRQVAGVTVLDLTGRVAFGTDTDALHQRLVAVFESGEHAILLNFHGVSSIDSAGLGELVSTYSELVRRGGMVRLVNVSERLRHLLAQTQLDQLFDIYDDETGALAAFNSEADSRTRHKLDNYLKRLA
jgi:anti-sigma B factor antagonist